jgi:transcriptional regulator with XRE-family HTH domain
MKKITIGERISKLRGPKTQAEFAKELRVTQGAVSAWERNDKDRAPSADVYFRLGSLAENPEDSLYFWGLAGLDAQAILSAAGKVFKDRFAPPVEGEIYRVPRSSLIERAANQPSVPVPGGLVQNPSSTGCLELGSESVGYWLAHGDLIVVDTSSDNVEALNGRAILAQFSREARGEGGLLLPSSEDGFVMGRLMVMSLEGSKRWTAELFPIGVRGNSFKYLLGSCPVKSGEEPGEERHPDIRLLPEWSIVGQVIAYYPREEWGRLAVRWE